RNREQRLVEPRLCLLPVDGGVAYGQAGVERGQAGEHPEPELAVLRRRHLGAHAAVEVSGPRIDSGTQRIAGSVVERGAFEVLTSAGRQRGRFEIELR